jgi:mannose-6-phosphate isomerase-like protein (cupin superfamily)
MRCRAAHIRHPHFITMSAHIIPHQTGEWLSFHGIPVEIIASSAFTQNRYTLCRGFARAGVGTPPHRHSFAEAFYVLSGAMAFRAGGDVVTLVTGDFLHVPGGVAHQPVTPGDGHCELLVLCVPGGFDAFQRATGLPAPGPDGPFPDDPDFPAKAAAAASRHGIEVPVVESEFTGASGVVVRRRGEGRRVATAGDIYTFIAAGAETGGAFSLLHAIVPPGGGPPPHTHTREDEAFYVLSGRLAIYDDTTRHEAGPGTFIHLQRDGRHRFANEFAEPAEMLILALPAGFEQMLAEVGQPWPDATAPAPHPSPEEIGRLKQLAPQYGVRLG